MLLSWNKVRVCIFLGEHHVLLSVISGRIKPKILKHIRFEIQNQQLDLVLLEVKDWLVDQVKKGQLEWLLGLTHVKHIVLPWNEQHLKPAFSNKLARHLFNQQYSEDVNNYEIQILDQGYGQPFIVSFVDKLLLQQLSELVNGTQFDNQLIQPLTFAVWNRFYPNIKKTTACVHIIDQDRVLSIEQTFGNISTLRLSPYHPQYSIENLKNSKSLNYLFTSDNHQEIHNDHNIRFLRLRSHGKENSAYVYTLCGVL